VGIPLSLVTIAGLPVMLGVGIDYAIQMHARVEEEVVIDRNPHPIQETARNLCPALLVVTFDAIFAFLALRFAKVPMIREFGLLLAVGIAVICFASIIVPLATLGIREYKSPTKGRDYREGPLGKLVVWLGALPIWMAPVLAVASLAVFLGGLAVEDKLVLQTDPVEWVNQSSDAIKDFRSVQDQTGSSSEMGIYITTGEKSVEPGKYSQQDVAFVDRFAAEEITKHPKELLTATALVTTSDYLQDVPGGGDLTPTPELVKSVYDMAPPDLKRSMVDPQTGAMNLIYRYGPGSLEERKDVVNAVRADAVAEAPKGLEATPSGLAVVGVGLLENLTSNRIILTYYALLFVGLFLAVRLRSVIRSLLSLVPVLIAVGAASLVAYVFNLKLSPMTAVGGPLVVAACTEFTSLILLRFIEERSRAQGCGGCHRISHRARLHRVGAHRHQRCRGHRHLTAPVAARLRHRRRHERGCRAPLGARGATPTAGVGGPVGSGLQAHDPRRRVGSNHSQVQGRQGLHRWHHRTARPRPVSAGCLISLPRTARHRSSHPR